MKGGRRRVCVKDKGEEEEDEEYTSMRVKVSS